MAPHKILNKTNIALPVTVWPSLFASFPCLSVLSLSINAADAVNAAAEWAHASASAICKYCRFCHFVLGDGFRNTEYWNWWCLRKRERKSGRTLFTEHKSHYFIRTVFRSSLPDSVDWRLAAFKSISFKNKRLNSDLLLPLVHVARSFCVSLMIRAEMGEEGRYCGESELILLLKKTEYRLYDAVTIFTALHGMQTRSSDENSVCLSVCLSGKRVDCDKKKKKICPDFYTIWKRKNI